MAIYVDRKLHTVPFDILTLHDLDFGLNHNCTNISLTVDQRQFVYIEDILEIMCGESFGIITIDLG